MIRILKSAGREEQCGEEVPLTGFHMETESPQDSMATPAPMRTPGCGLQVSILGRILKPWESMGSSKHTEHVVAMYKYTVS